MNVERDSALLAYFRIVNSGNALAQTLTYPLMARHFRLQQHKGPQFEWTLRVHIRTDCDPPIGRMYGAPPSEVRAQRPISLLAA